jgi:hypothetical protein
MNQQIDCIGTTSGQMPIRHAGINNVAVPSPLREKPIHSYVAMAVDGNCPLDLNPISNGIGSSYPQKFWTATTNRTAAALADSCQSLIRIWPPKCSTHAVFGSAERYPYAPYSIPMIDVSETTLHISDACPVDPDEIRSLCQGFDQTDVISAVIHHQQQIRARI